MLAPAPSSLHTMSKGHFDMPRSGRPLISLTMMPLKLLKERQEASLYTPEVYKDDKRGANGYPSRCQGPLTYGAPTPCWLLETKEEEETYHQLSTYTSLYLICGIQ